MQLIIKQDENQNGVDGDYDFDQMQMDEQLFDTESNKQSSEKVSQRINTGINDKDYKIYTKEFDQIEKAELLETSEPFVADFTNCSCRYFELQHQF